MQRLLAFVLILTGCASAPEATPEPAPHAQPGETSGNHHPIVGSLFIEAPPLEWWQAPEPAMCTVHVSQQNGEDVLESVRHFEGGRQVSGTSHPAVGSVGQSRVTYDEAGLVRIDYQRADPESGRECEGIECYVPPTRIRGTLEVRYDADGRVAGQFDRRLAYQQQGEQWRARWEREESLTYTYDAEGRRTGFHSTMGGEASGTLRYEGSRLVARHLERDDFRVDLTYTYDAEGRVASRTRVSCRTECSEPHTTTLEYDAEGRLTATRAPDRTVAYTYDADGHLTSQNAGLPIQYRYDEGRLVEVRRGAAGRATTQYRYEGDCDGVDLSPRAPSPHEGSEIELCIQDPVHAVESCLPLR